MPNQYKNKVVYGDSVLMDITDTTAEAGDVASGAVFYAKNGARTVGTFTQAQSDWDENDTTDPAYILNKPTIPTNVSELINDAGYTSCYDVPLTKNGSTIVVQDNFLSLYTLFNSTTKIYFKLPLSQTESIPMEISHVDTTNEIFDLFAIVDNTKYTVSLQTNSRYHDMRGSLKIDRFVKPAFFGGQWINYGNGTANPQYGSHILLTNYTIDNTLYNTSLLLYAIPDYEISNTNSPLISLYKGYTENGVAITYGKDSSSPYFPVWNWDAGEHSISVSQAYVYMPMTIPSASSTTPLADGTAAIGTSTNYARADHVHPKIPIDSTLSTTSENPVQNKVIRSALVNKLDVNSNYNPIPLEFPDPENPPSILDGATVTCGMGFAHILELYQLAIDTTFEMPLDIQNCNFIDFHPFRMDETSESIELFSIFDNTIYTITLEPNTVSGMPHGMIGTLHVDAIPDPITIDTTMSSSSTNPVTNSAITTAIANNRGKVFYGVVDNTSTATAFTAQIPGITAYEEGLVVILKNGVVTSASGFTININGLGALPAYNNLGAESRETTIFNVAYTMMFVYENRVSGGDWLCYRGYDANTNTIGYQLRTNSMSLPMKSITYRYRLLFTSADGAHFVPANNTTSTNATASRAVCQDKIDPFGPIYYYSTTASVAANSRPSAVNLWEQYTVALGYSFNRTGAALTLTPWAPVYVKCAPQADGSAIIDSTTPYVQALPTTADGKIYIFLGVAYSATNIELVPYHPVYCYRNGGIQIWSRLQSEVDDLAAIINGLVDADEVAY